MGSGSKKTNKPRRVPFWDRGRDKELSDIEAMACDGLRLSNAELLTLSHLRNGSLDPSHQLMSYEAVLRAFYTLCNLLYVTLDHFLRLSQHLKHLRKWNAVRALNLLDAEPFLESPIDLNLFGGKWDDLYKKDSERRKERYKALRTTKQETSKTKPPQIQGQSKPQTSQQQFFRRSENRAPEKKDGGFSQDKGRKALQASKVETSREVAVTATGAEGVATKAVAVAEKVVAEGPQNFQPA